MMDIVVLCVVAVAGAILGGFLFAVPGVTVYLATWGILGFIYSDPRFVVPPITVAAFLMSLTVSYSFINTVPAIVFSSPDSLTIFLANAKRRCLHRRCAYEECMTVGTGSLIGIVLLAVGTPLYFYPGRYFRLSFAMARLFPWLMGAVIFYMVGEEFIAHLRAARKTGRGSEYRAMAAGPAIFLLIGIFGAILFYFGGRATGHPIKLIAPGLMGLILVPNMLRGAFLLERGARNDKKSNDDGMKAKVSGTVAGYLCGHFAILLGVLAPGRGTFWASRIIPEERKQAFLIAQGVAKTIYLVVSFLLYFVPFYMMSRGGMTQLVKPFITPGTVQDYFMMLAVILISGGVSYYMLPVAAKLALGIRQRMSAPALAAGIVALIGLFSLVTGGLPGMAFLLLGSALGSLPLIFGCRPYAVFAFWLVPKFLNLTGLWSRMAALLGLQ